MSGKVATYAPSEFKLSILGADVIGFSNGVFASLERTDPVFGYRRAIDGRVNVFIKKNATRRLTFTIERTSPSNTWIHLLFNLFTEYGISFKIPIFFKDQSGETSFFATECYFEEEPTINFSEDVDGVTWTIVCFDGKPVIGGNVADSDSSKAINLIQNALSISSLVGVDLSSLKNKASEYIERFL